MKQVFPPSKITVVGLGYVGCVTGACLSELGHSVIGVDRDSHKVDSVMSGRAPFFEPGLEGLIRSNREAGRLSATTSFEESVQTADVVLICVGTPSEKNGNLGLDQLKRVSSELGKLFAASSTKPIVAIRSTVFPGTCEDVVMPLLGTGAAVVSNPEFLREGAAVKDFMEPSLLVVGGNNDHAVRRVAALYERLGVFASLVSLRTAEMIKYACNAFHATKIAFANEIGSLSSSLGVDAQEVMTTVCADVKLNASPAYLKPGFAFGGSCLPKDLRALVYRSGRLDLQLPLLESVLSSNDRHLDRCTDSVLALPSGKLGVLGLAFKEDTDDLRESPVVSMLEQLIGKGRDIRVFDPHIQLDTIYGTNRHFILNSIPHIGRLMVSDVRNVLDWSDYLIVTQKQKPEVAQAIRQSGLPTLDLTLGVQAAPVPALS